MARVPFKPKPNKVDKPTIYISGKPSRFPVAKEGQTSYGERVGISLDSKGGRIYTKKDPNMNTHPLPKKEALREGENIRIYNLAAKMSLAAVGVIGIIPGETKLTAQFSNKVDVNGKPYVRVSVIERDVATGRFLKTNTTNLRPSDAMRLRDDYLAGNKSAEGVRGIINAYQHRAAKGLVKSGFNKMKQIVTEQHRLTDLQEAQFNELVSMMSEDDFEIFYARYKNTVDEVFYSSDTRMDSDAQIAANDKKVRGRLSYDEKEAISEALIKDLADYNNISIEALNLKIAGQTQKTLIEYTR